MFWDGKYPAKASRQARFPLLVARWPEFRWEKKKRPKDCSWSDLLGGFVGHDEQQACGPLVALWKARNDHAHRMATRTNDDRQANELLGRMLPLFEAALSDLYGDLGFQLLGRQPDGRTGLFHGTTPVATDDRWPAGLGELSRVSRSGEDWLPLEPFFESPQEAEHPALEDEPLYMIERWSRHSVIVIGARAHRDRPDLLQPLSDVLARKSLDLLLRREDAPPHALAAISRSCAVDTLEALTGRKYFPELYVERDGVDHAFQQALSGSRQAIVVLGEAGSGKSSLLARTAEKLIGDEDELDEQPEDLSTVIYLSGLADFSGERGWSAETLLTEVIARQAGFTTGQFGGLADLLTRLSDQGSREVFILLDAVNEADRFVDLGGALDQMFAILDGHHGVRVVVSMRKGAYDSLKRRRQTLMSHHPGVFQNERNLALFPTEEDWAPFLMARSFSAEETERAYRRRQQEDPGRSVHITYGELDEDLQSTLSSPLHLHLYHQTFYGHDVPAVADIDAAQYQPHEQRGDVL